MNLVHVDNVVAALAFLVRLPKCENQVYIISDDEWPANNFRDVEAYLMRHFRLPPYRRRPIQMPRAMLRLALRCAGRTNTNPFRTYDASKIRKAGLEKPVAFEAGIAEFAQWYSTQGA